MSLSSALYTGVSGLTTLGNAMTVIGDNIANVNTVGFKASRVTFQDVLSQHVATTAGTTQIGCGTALGDISSSFAQGSFESTDSATDLAINGEGFFVVRDPNNEENEYYTRAGEFRFDKDGNLVNPGGYIVRGNVLSEDTTGDIEDVGSITDIVLSSFTSPPSPTDQITVITNLDADAADKSATLATQWDGTDADGDGSCIGENSYEYQTTIKVYDSLGDTHDITIYYDKGSTASTYEYIVTCSPGEDSRSGIDSNQPGVGMLGRGTITFNELSGAISDINFDAFNAANTTTEIGTPVVTQYNPTTPVASGTYTGTSSLTYTFTVDTAGNIGGAKIADPVISPQWGIGGHPDVTASPAYTGTSTLTYSFRVNTAGNIGPGTVVEWSTDGTTWTQHTPAGGGVEAVTGIDTGLQIDFGEVAEPLAADDAFTVTCYAPARMDWTDGTNSGTITLNGDAEAVGVLGLQVDFGEDDEILNTGDTFTVGCYTDNDVNNTNCWDTKSEATHLTNGYFTFNVDFLGGTTTSTDKNIKLDFGSVYNSSSSSWVNDSLSTAQYSALSTTIFQSANGYGAGDIQSVTVGTDGVITGKYSNGQVIPLYRVALAKFHNDQGLSKEGGNLFKETLLSGNPVTNIPGTSGLGTILPNSLEQSNVDIATEFVKMITTQRGFQANSKIITVTDQMLAELINLKR